ncbi:MAG: hypothetical protein JSW72_08295 [Candidatus Bathyarchaeota archaeon]|nr:MAG: hypothetical protein JSW72_08295 [Candidatus Bathyarchaeota archaeon]
MSFSVAPIQRGDVDSCVEMIASTLGDLSKSYYDKNVLKNMIQGDQVLTLVAKREKKIVGLINTSLLGFPRIMFLTVADKRSAQEGLGSMLIDRIVETIKKKLPNSKKILHQEFADSCGAIGLFSINGFKIIGFIKDPVTSRDVVFMERAI